MLVSKAVVMSESKKNKDKDGGMLALLSVGTKMADSLNLMDIRYHSPAHMVSALSEAGSVEVWDFSGD